MKKILFLSYYWPPSGGPGVQRALKFVKYFPDFNIFPTVVTVDENQASYPLIDKSLNKEVSSKLKVIRTASFEPLSIYRRFNKRKEIPYSGFVNIDKNTFFQKISRFIRGNFFIPDARVGWVNYAYKSALKELSSQKIDAIITTSPPHSSQLIGLKLKTKTGLPWIADLRDPWTDIFFYNDFYHLPYAKRLDKKYERQVLEKADHIIVTSQATKELYLTKSDQLKADKISVIPNGYDEFDFAKKVSFSEKEFIITYSGTIADQQQIDTLLKAISNIRKKHASTPIKLRFVGNVSEGIQGKLTKNGIDDICEFVGYLPHADSIDYLLKSSILLLVIPKVKNNSGLSATKALSLNVPGKIFEYLASRKPIICIGPEDCNVNDYINECAAGKTFDYENIKVEDYLEELFLKWKENPNLNLSNNEYKKYSRKELSSQFSEIIKGL